MTLNYRKLYPIILILILITSGCATIRGKKQNLRLACNTPQCEVFSKSGEKLGTAPGLIAVKREYNSTLIFKSGKFELSQKLESRFRWLDSFAANLTLSYITSPFYSLYSLGIDLFTGAAWNFDNPEVVKLANSPAPSLAPLIIAIAPPEAETEVLSDSIGKLIQNTLMQKYPKAKILDYHETLVLFQRYGYTYDHPFESEISLIKFLEKVNISNLCESKTFINGNSIYSKIKIMDAYRPQSVIEFKQEWSTSDLKDYSVLSKSLWKQKALELIPNSIGIGARTGATIGKALESIDPLTGSFHYLELEQIPNSDLIAGNFGLMASQLNPEFEDRFQYIFRWSVDSHFNRSRYKLLQSTFSVDKLEKINYLGTFGIYNLGLGIGPEIGVAGQFGYIFLNLIPTLGFHFVDYEGRNKNEFLGSTELNYNFGYLNNVGGNFFFRFGIGISGLNQKNITHIFQKYANAKLDASYIYQTQVFFSLEYYFPQGRNRLKRNAVDYLNSM